MSGSVEFGKCEICGKEAAMERTYYRYDIVCACHSPYHFELIRHCKGCVPKEPKETTVIIRTIHLTHIN